VPRPSSPVHAKASTKCSYLTLENPHHQHQTWQHSQHKRLHTAHANHTRLYA